MTDVGKIAEGLSAADRSAIHVNDHAYGPSGDWQQRHAHWSASTRTVERLRELKLVEDYPKLALTPLGLQVQACLREESGQ